MVDSTPLQQEASRIFIKSFGKIFLPSEGREGMRMIDIVREYKDIFDLPGSVEELYLHRQDIFYDLVRQKLELFPGVWPLLAKLKNRNLKLAIATSGDRSYMNNIFAKFPNLSEFFKVVIVSEDVERGKPDPEVYLKTLQALKVKAEEAVVLEDSINGIIAAKAAHIQVICVPNKNYPEADYSEADKVFNSLEEVEKAIV